MPFVERTPSGTRLFKDSDLETLKIVECLKSTGMPIKDIKNFIDWCSEGDSTLQQRYDMFMERKDAVEAKMEELKKTMELIKHKCWYYKTSLDAGAEDIHRNKKQGIAFLYNRKPLVFHNYVQEIQVVLFVFI